MFGKVFASTWEGSMIGKPDVQLVWCFLLAHSDARGLVEKSRPHIAALTGLTLDRVHAAIAQLEAPDPDSRTPDEEGRRLLRTTEHRDWGWQIVNHARYRAIRDADDRREQARAGMQRLREQRALTVNDVSRGLPMAEDRGQRTDTATPSLRDGVPGAQPAPAPDPGQGGQANAPADGASVPVLALTTPGPAQGTPEWPWGAGRTLLPIAPRRGQPDAEWSAPVPMLYEWRALYPAVDLNRALANMRGWLLANPTRRPTARGVVAFVNKWLRGDQDKAAMKSQPGPRRSGARRGSDARYGAANGGQGNE